MKTPPLLATLCLLLLAFSPSCRKSKVIVTPHTPPAASTLLPGTFIDKTGSYIHSDGKGTSKLDLTGSGTTIHWNFVIKRPLPGGGGSSGGTSGGGITLAAPGDPWFVYVESPRRLWFFDGTKDLDYSLNDDGGGRAGPAIFDGKLQYSDHKVPDEVIRKLPAELQKLFPPPPPAGPRPSI